MKKATVTYLVNVTHTCKEYPHIFHSFFYYIMSMRNVRDGAKGQTTRIIHKVKYQHSKYSYLSVYYKYTLVSKIRHT